MSVPTPDARASARLPARHTVPTSGHHGAGSPRGSVLRLLAAGVLWGAGGPIGRLLATATGLAGPAIAAYRLGLGGLILVGWWLARRIPLPRSGTAWRHVCVLGVLAAVFQAAFFSAIRLGSVSLATLVAIGSAPLVVLVTERVRGAVTTGRQLRAATTGLVGLALLVGAPEGGRSAGSVGACAGLALLAGTAFAAFTLKGRSAPPDLDPQAAVGLAFTAGGAVLALGAASTVGMGGVMDPRGMVLLAALAVGPTALAYALFFSGLREASASTAVVIALLEPTTATVLAVGFLHETLTVIGLVGAVLLLASVVDVARTEARGSALIL